MKKLFVASLIAASALAGAVEFRIEGEHVPNKNNWVSTNVTHSVAGYLAYAKNHKKGDEAGNTASGNYGVPEPGKYYVWVRTYDFGEGYRKTTITINGKKIGTFGDGPVTKKGKPEFKWKRAMLPVELTDKIDLTMRAAVTACRVDSILFTTDKDYKPADDEKAFAESVDELESND